MKKGFCLIVTVILLAGCSQVSTVAPTPTPVKAQPLQTDFDANPYLSLPIDVTVSGGRANFHDIVGYATYRSVSFKLSNKQVKTKWLIKAGNNFFDSKVPLTLYYQDGRLYVDYNKREAHDPKVTAKQFTIHQAWLNGKTYQHINTYGQPGLRDVTVTIKVEK